MSRTGPAHGTTLLLGGVALATLVVAVVYRLVKARLVRRSAVMRGALQGR